LVAFHAAGIAVPSRCTPVLNPTFHPRPARSKLLLLRCAIKPANVVSSTNFASSLPESLQCWDTIYVGKSKRLDADVGVGCTSHCSVGLQWWDNPLAPCFLQRCVHVRAMPLITRGGFKRSKGVGSNGIIACKIQFKSERRAFHTLLLMR
jgi:hypothetical protein